jgi:hypothetical protein
MGRAGNTQRGAYPQFCAERFKGKNRLGDVCTIHAGSRGSDSLRAGRPRGRSSSPNRVKNVIFSTASRPALGPTQPPIQWVPGAPSPGVERPGREADHSQVVQEYMDRYIHSPIRLHGVVLN